MALNLGRLVHNVTIQQLTQTVGPSRMLIDTWSTLATAWMSQESVRGSERYVAGQVSAPSSIQWCMRYLASMDPTIVDVPKTRRLLYQGRAYDIESAEMYGRKVSIEIVTLSKSKVPS